MKYVFLILVLLSFMGCGKQSGTPASGPATYPTVCGTSFVVYGGTVYTQDFQVVVNGQYTTHNCTYTVLDGTIN